MLLVFELACIVKLILSLAYCIALEVPVVVQCKVCNNYAILIKDRDFKLFKNVIGDDHIFHDLLPPKRRRVLREHKHNFILPRVKTKCFKHFFLNKCLFN